MNLVLKIALCYAFAASCGISVVIQIFYVVKAYVINRRANINEFIDNDPLFWGFVAANLALTCLYYFLIRTL
jgi:hypothetical protein